MIRALAALYLSAVPALAESVLRLQAGVDRLEFHAAQISLAEASRAGGPVLRVQLTEDAGAALAAFTGAHVGEEIVISACGEVIVRPRVVEPLTSGAMAVSMPSPRDAARIAALLLGEIRCAEHAPRRG